MSDEITEERVKELLEESLAEKGLDKLVETFRKEHHIHRGSHKEEIADHDKLENYDALRHLLQSEMTEVDADKLDGKEGSEYALVAQEDWVAPSLLNSWANFGSGYTPAGYFKDSLGIVHLRGLIKDGTLTSSAFLLPTGYRPAYHQYFSVASNNAYGDCYISLTGDVTPYTGSNTWFSLNGITFRAA